MKMLQSLPIYLQNSLKQQFSNLVPLLPSCPHTLFYDPHRLPIGHSTSKLRTVTNKTMHYLYNTKFI